MATLMYLNGVPVQSGGYYSDQHGHIVLVRPGQLLPACPAYPYENTAWRLHSPVIFSHDDAPGPQAA